MRVVSAAFILVAVAAIVMIRSAGVATGAPTFDGKEVFRFDTFGDEQLWTDVLRMHEAIAQVDPVTALSVGLKVDAEALPAGLVGAVRAGKVDLASPAGTIELLRLNA